MNTFVSAVKKANNKTVTENGMKAFKSTLDACVDLFYFIGASRGKNVLPQFKQAYAEDREMALRIVQWARDVRGGAGERKIFRDVLKYLEVANPKDAIVLARKVPLIGRWDDLLVFDTLAVKVESTYPMILDALESGDGLCAKWMPRKGEIAVELRSAFTMTPKQYRKTLVNLTKVVETQMCAQAWDDINFSHVPSLAASRYRKAFKRNAEIRYTEYAEALAAGKEGVKINARAVYPYDVLKMVIQRHGATDMPDVDKKVILAQWAALPNYLGDQKILAMVDVSGSMTCSVGGSKSLTCMGVAISLGLYVAEKLEGKFKDTFLTFSGTPELLHLPGDVLSKWNKMQSSAWDMNTDLDLAFKKILDVAVKGKVPANEMPDTVLILSDMQFDGCVSNKKATGMIKKNYEDAGYKMPKVVFWNLSANYNNVPAKANKEGVALVSGFSPSVLKGILAAKDFTPRAIMVETVGIERYDI